MTNEWEIAKFINQKPSYRWGHSSCVLSQNQLVIYGGYADSIFLNDIWIYKISQNQWFKATIPVYNQTPLQRSNCTFIYCQQQKKIIMFGGGSSQNKRYNDLWSLKPYQNKESNQYEGLWQKIQITSQQMPWGRTYHISQLYENFIIIQGGESCLGQVQDLWALDVQNFNWIQLKSINKIQPRKFHSSAILNNNLFLIGGIYGDYQPLNQILFTNLSVLKSKNLQNINNNNFEWQKVQLKSTESISLGRWGHISKAFDSKIFIFGGRTTTDLNDLTVFNPIDNSLTKINTHKPPQGRRKPSAQLIGSYLLINSGYNGKYLNDLCWINLRFIKQSKQLTTIRSLKKSLQSNKTICDIHINTKDNKYINLYSKIARNSFESQDHMIGFLQQIAQMKYSQAKKYVDIINYGFLSAKKRYQIPNQQNKYQDNENIDLQILRKYKITYSTNELLANKKKILFNVLKQNSVMNLNPNKLIRVNQAQFQRIYAEITNDPTCDAKILISSLNNVKQHQLKCCKQPLILRSQYINNVFKYDINSKLNKKDDISSKQTKSHYKQIVLQIKLLSAKILIMYCYYGHIIVPNTFTLYECFQLYEDAQRYSFLQVIKISFQQIKEFIYSNQILLDIQKQFQKNYVFKNLKFNPQSNQINNQTYCRTSKNQKIKNIHQSFNQILQFCYLKSNYKQNVQFKSESEWMQLLEYMINKVSQYCLQKVIKQKKNKSGSFMNGIGSVKSLFPLKSKANNQNKQNINSNEPIHSKIKIIKKANGKNSNEYFKKDFTPFHSNQNQLRQFQIRNQSKYKDYSKIQISQDQRKNRTRQLLYQKQQEKQSPYTSQKIIQLNDIMINMNFGDYLQSLHSTNTNLTLIQLIFMLININIIYPFLSKEGQKESFSSKIQALVDNLHLNLEEYIKKLCFVNKENQVYVNNQQTMILKMKQNVQILNNLIQKQLKINSFKYNQIRSIDSKRLQ